MAGFSPRTCPYRHHPGPSCRKPGRAATRIGRQRGSGAAPGRFAPEWANPAVPTVKSICPTMVPKRGWSPQYVVDILK